MGTTVRLVAKIFEAILAVTWQLQQWRLERAERSG